MNECMNKQGQLPEVAGSKQSATNGPTDCTMDRPTDCATDQPTDKAAKN